MTQKNNQKLRIGIIGAGSIVRARHLPALKKNPEVEIVAVSNSTYESSEKFCRENLPHATPLRNCARHTTAKLAGTGSAPRLGHHLDRHAAVHAFGGDDLRA